MKLSLWILKDHLKQYNPEITWTEPGNPLDNYPMERFIAIEKISLFNDTKEFNSSTLYIGISDDYFCDSGTDVVCRFNNYYLSLNCRDIKKIMNELLNIFFYYQDLEKKWLHFIYEECSLIRLTDSATEIFNNPVIILDSSDSLIAYSSEFADQYIDDEWHFLIKEKGTAFSRSMDFHNPSYSFLKPEIKDPYKIPDGLFPKETYNCSLYYESKWCGSCGLIIYNTPASTGYLHLFKIFCDYVQLCIEQMVGLKAFPTNSVYLLQAAEGKTEVTYNMVRLLRMSGWAENDLLLLIKAVPERTDFPTGTHLCRAVSSFSQYIMAADNGGEIIILSDVTRLSEEKLVSFLKEYLKRASYRGGISNPFRDPGEIPAAVKQAETALLYNEGIISYFSDYVTPFFMDSLAEIKDAVPVHPLLPAMQSYDSKYKTKYYQTLFSYLKNERNHSLTAAELDIHRNTLFRRLEKIEEIFSPDLEDSSNRFFLLFSFYANEK